VRGWVHAGVCYLIGALATVLFCVWLTTAWPHSNRVVVTEKLRVMAIKEAAQASE
jgi:hypothetical protein